MTDTGRDRSPEVRSMFDRIAPSYDRTNRLMTFGLDNRWRRLAVQQLELGAADTVLDIGCGTGDFLALLGQTPARRVGLDFSGGMLLEARRLRPRAPVAQGDARRLPIRTASVSGVVSGFTLRNFSPLEPALAEMGRVLAPGGHLALLEVDTPANPLFRLGHRVYFRGIVPVLGGLLSGDRPAYRYLPASASYLPPQRELVAMLQRSGFHRIQKRRLGLGAVQMLTATKAG
jgi:demethylmenaquinone methyltransferase/2-methoxy-6-polyprenyl-1,4-benzoquinol methylase